MVLALPSLGLLLGAALALQGGGPDGFEAYVWRSAPADAGARAVWESAGGVILQRGEARDAWLESGLALGLFNAAGRDDLHLEREREGYAERWQRWYDTRDASLLVREPCLSAASTRARLRETLSASLAAPGSARLAWLSLGDEVGLTPHGAPEDLCLSPSCRAAWTQFLAGRSDLDAAERRAWADPLSGSTDRARAALSEGDLAALRPWFLRRQFQCALVEGVLLELSAQARAQAPGVPLALLGLGAQSPFGTPRIERDWSRLEVLEAYRESDARELLLTLRGKSARVLLTVFPDDQPADQVVATIWEHALSGGDGVVLWSDRSLAASPELNARLAAAIQDVRRVGAQTAGTRFAPGGVALVHDFESICLDWLGDALLDGPTWPRRFASHQLRTGTWERAASGWLQLARDCGQLPGAVPLESVGAATVERFGLLILSQLRVLSAEELVGLQAYLAAGGSLLVSGELGRCDARGALPARPALEQLRALAPERVLVAGQDAADYLDERRLRTPSARAWRERARGWFAAAGLQAPPWELAPAHADLPWLQSWSRTAGGDVIGAVLPAWRDIEGNAPLDDVMLEVRLRAGERLQWLHPAEGQPGEPARLLRAGDAAVFKILR